MAATITGKTFCVKCKKPKHTVKCDGCSQDLCFNHIIEHRNELTEQLNKTEDQLKEFKTEMDEQKAEPEKHELMKRIDQWERESIEKIRQVAHETRQDLTGCVTKVIADLDIKLKHLTTQLIQCRHEEDFIDTDIQFFKEELERLKDMLKNPPDLKIYQDSISLINRIRLTMKPSSPPNATVNATTKWIQTGITVAGGNGYGNGTNQLYYPQGLCFDDEQSVYIAEWSNHRLVKWKHGATTGRIVAGGNGQGNYLDQLNSPTDVVVDKENDCLIICDFGNKRVIRWPRQNGTNGETIISNIGCNGLTLGDNGFLYIVDYVKHEVRRYRKGDNEGTVVAGGNGPGNRLDQLHHPRYIFVDRDHSVYISDESNHRVMKWVKDAKEGIIVAGGQGQGNGLKQLSYPNGIFVDPSGILYVADGGNNRIIRWPQGATQGSIIIGGGGQGSQSSQLSFPIGLSFDREGNLHVSDYRNHRVQKFSVDRN